MKEHIERSCYSCSCDTMMDENQPSSSLNEPLTVEQLREMIDELVYLKVFDLPLKSDWQVIKSVTEDKIVFKSWQTVYVPIDGMGKYYNLYRCSPDEL